MYFRAFFTADRASIQHYQCATQWDSIALAALASISHWKTPAGGTGGWHTEPIERTGAYVYAVTTSCRQRPRRQLLSASNRGATLSSVLKRAELGPTIATRTIRSAHIQGCNI